MFVCVSVCQSCVLLPPPPTQPIPFLPSLNTLARMFVWAGASAEMDLSEETDKHSEAEEAREAQGYAAGRGAWKGQIEFVGGWAAVQEALQMR